MTQPKASLEEMARLCLDEAQGLYDRIKMSEKRWPNLAPDTPSYRKVFVLRSAGTILATMAYAEDRARKFIAGLMAEQRG